EAPAAAGGAVARRRSRLRAGGHRHHALVEADEHVVLPRAPASRRGRGRARARNGTAAPEDPDPLARHFSTSRLTARRGRAGGDAGRRAGRRRGEIGWSSTANEPTNALRRANDEGAARAPSLPDLGRACDILRRDNGRGERRLGIAPAASRGIAPRPTAAAP